MGYFPLVLLLGLIPAAIAQGKGRSFMAWWIYGSLLFIIALPHALIMKRDEAAIARRDGLRKCPHCAELIQLDAKVCKHCGRDVPPEEARKCAGCGEPLGHLAERCAECGKTIEATS